jgi:hypothetical protein
LYVSGTACGKRNAGVLACFHYGLILEQSVDVFGGVFFGLKPLVEVFYNKFGMRAVAVG